MCRCESKIRLEMGERDRERGERETRQKDTHRVSENLRDRRKDRRCTESEVLVDRHTE